MVQTYLLKFAFKKLKFTVTIMINRSSYENYYFIFSFLLNSIIVCIWLY